MENAPNDLRPRDRYRLLIGTIVPRPIAMVTTISPGGVPNLAPFSFFNGVGANPMTVMFCPANRPDGGEKDTLRNAKPEAEGGTGEFVINIGTEACATRLAAAAEPLPYEENEIDWVGFTAVPSQKVAPPRIAESPVRFECRTIRVVRLNAGQPGGANLVLGEVVWIGIDDRVLNEAGRVAPDCLAAVGRMGGISYCRTRDRFDLPLGRDALTQPNHLAAEPEGPS